jgi:hypothetical protein
MRNLFVQFGKSHEAAGKDGLSTTSAEPRRYMPSTMNDRDFVDFSRMSFTSFCAGDSFQALALSTLSKEITTKRFGAVRSSAVISSVRTTNCPLNACTAPGALGSNVLNTPQVTQLSRMANVLMSIPNEQGEQS